MNNSTDSSSTPIYPLADPHSVLPKFPDVGFICVFDTETTSLEKPFCYNIGYVILNTATGEIVKKSEYVVEQVWHNLMLFTTAYYANKRPIYVGRMRSRQCELNKFGYITQAMIRDFREYDVHHAFAYNSGFDEKVFAFNCDWFKCINPLEGVQVHDIRGHVHKKIGFTKGYRDYCDAHDLYTESGNYSTTAESVYRYVSGKDEFIEEHTALADAVIEAEILRHCVEQGCEWAQDYKVYTTIPRITMKDFKVIDAEGVTHTFPFTKQTKIRGEYGYKLTIQEPKK